MLAVEDLIAIGLVRGIEKPAAKVWQDANLKVVVLQVKGAVDRIHFLYSGVVVHRVGIHGTLCPLICKVSFK